MLVEPEIRVSSIIESFSILIIDDQYVQEYVDDLYKIFGNKISIHSAKSSGEAIRKFKKLHSEQNTPKIIFTDINLDIEGEGKNIAEKIKNSDTKIITVGFTSNPKTFNEIENLKNNIFNECLKKNSNDSNFIHDCFAPIVERYLDIIEEKKNKTSYNINIAITAQCINNDNLIDIDVNDALSKMMNTIKTIKYTPNIFANLLNDVKELSVYKIYTPEYIFHIHNRFIIEPENAVIIQKKIVRDKFQRIIINDLEFNGSSIESINSSITYTFFSAEIYNSLSFFSRKLVKFFILNNISVFQSDIITERFLPILKFILKNEDHDIISKFLEIEFSSKIWESSVLNSKSIEIGQNIINEINNKSIISIPKIDEILYCNISLDDFDIESDFTSVGIKTLDSTSTIPIEINFRTSKLIEWGLGSKYRYFKYVRIVTETGGSKIEIFPISKNVYDLIK